MTALNSPAKQFEPLNGNCSCGAISYTILALPLITHCCHCTCCQRETGTAFVLNTQIETYNFRLTSLTQPILASVPAPSGAPQLVAHCPTCHIALYSHYGGRKEVVHVKVGTLAEGSRQRVRPDVQIYTGTKADWVDLKGEQERGVGVFEEYYVREKVWRREALDRRERLLEWVKEKVRNGETIGEPRP